MAAPDNNSHRTLGDFGADDVSEIVESGFDAGDIALDRKQIDDEGSDPRVLIVEDTGKRADEVVVYEQPGDDPDVYVHNHHSNRREYGEENARVYRCIYVSSLDRAFGEGNWDGEEISRISQSEEEISAEDSIKVYPLPSSRLTAQE